MYRIGVDLGGTNIAVGVIDENYSIIGRAKTKTACPRPAEEIFADMCKCVKAAAEDAGIAVSEIASIGIGTPGTVDKAKGIISYANNLDFNNVPAVELMKKEFPDTIIRLENDANCAALGEALAGSASGADCAVMITLGTGVGSGIIVGGKIFSGGINGAGAELGHTVISVDGRQCTCGRRGCFETYSSASALTAFTKEKIHELELKGIDSLLRTIAEEDGKVSARTAFKAMKDGDEYGKALVDEYVKYLAAGITNVINTFQPEIISIGGGVSNEGETLVAPLRALVDREQYTRDNKVKTKIVTATLGNDAGIVGAAGLGK